MVKLKPTSSPSFNLCTKLLTKANIVAYSFAAGEAEGAIVTPENRAIYDQYVRGECTLEQVIEQAMSTYRQSGRVVGC